MAGKNRGSKRKSKPLASKPGDPEQHQPEEPQSSAAANQPEESDSPTKNPRLSIVEALNEGPVLEPDEYEYQKRQAHLWVNDNLPEIPPFQHETPPFAHAQEELPSQIDNLETLVERPSVIPDVENDPVTANVEHDPVPNDVGDEPRYDANVANSADNSAIPDTAPRNRRARYRSPVIDVKSGKFSLRTSKGTKLFPVRSAKSKVSPRSSTRRPKSMYESITDKLSRHLSVRAPKDDTPVARAPSTSKVSSKTPRDRPASMYATVKDKVKRGFSVRGRSTFHHRVVKTRAKSLSPATIRRSTAGHTVKKPAQGKTRAKSLSPATIRRSTAGDTVKKSARAETRSSDDNVQGQMLDLPDINHTRPPRPLSDIRTGPRPRPQSMQGPSQGQVKSATFKVTGMSSHTRKLVKLGRKRTVSVETVTETPRASLTEIPRPPPIPEAPKLPKPIELPDPNEYKPGQRVSFDDLPNKLKSRIIRTAFATTTPATYLYCETHVNYTLYKSYRSVGQLIKTVISLNSVNREIRRLSLVEFRSFVKGMITYCEKRETTRAIFDLHVRNTENALMERIGVGVAVLMARKYGWPADRAWTVWVEYRAIWTGTLRSQFYEGTEKHRYFDYFCWLAARKEFDRFIGAAKIFKDLVQEVANLKMELMGLLTVQAAVQRKASLYEFCQAVFRRGKFGIAKREDWADLWETPEKKDRCRAIVRTFEQKLSFTVPSLYNALFACWNAKSNPNNLQHLINCAYFFTQSEEYPPDEKLHVYDCSEVLRRRQMVIDREMEEQRQRDEKMRREEKRWDDLDSGMDLMAGAYGAVAGEYDAEQKARYGEEEMEWETDDEEGEDENDAAEEGAEEDEEGVFDETDEEVTPK